MKRVEDFFRARRNWAGALRTRSCFMYEIGFQVRKAMKRPTFSRLSRKRSSERAGEECPIFSGTDLTSLATGNS
jgi:hypothetical protein